MYIVSQHVGGLQDILDMNVCMCASFGSHPNLRVGEALTPWLTLAAFVHVASDWLKPSTQRAGLRNVHLVGQRMMVRSCDNQHRGVKVMFIYKGLLVYNLCGALRLGLAMGRLRALQTTLPEPHHWLPEVVLAVEVGIAYADKCAGQVSLSELVN